MKTKAILLMTWAMASPGFCFATVEDKSNCDTASLTKPYWYCVLEQEYCETTQTAPATVVNGTTVWVEATRICEVCDETCNTEYPPANTDSCTHQITVAHTTTKSHSVTGAISGATFIPLIQASLEVQVAETNGIEISFTDSMTRTPDPCGWKRTKAKIKTIQGHQMEVDVIMNPIKKWDCLPGLSQGAEELGKVTMTASYAVSSTGTIGADGNGLCPPDPPLE